MFRNVVVENKATESSRVGIRVLLIGIAMLTLSQSAGCKLGIKDAAMLTYRDEVWSRRAYNLRYGSCAREYSEHFQNGFRAGYTDMSNGGDGYVPALPPEQYRSAEYQSSDGAKCVNSWFEGYPAGVAAAKKDKSGTYHDILISRMINSAVSQSKTKPTLPGDVPEITRNSAPQGTGNPIPVVQPPSKSEYIPLNSEASTLSPATFDAPPQAKADLPESEQTEPADVEAKPEVMTASSETSEDTPDNTADVAVHEEDTTAEKTESQASKIAPAIATESTK